MFTIPALALALSIGAPEPAPSPGWMPLPQESVFDVGVAPELRLRTFVPGHESDALARLGRLAPTRFEFESPVAGRVTLLGQLLEPGAPLPLAAGPGAPVASASGLRLDPGLAAVLGTGWITPQGALSIDLPPACALPLGSRLLVQGHLASAQGVGASFSEPLVLELVDRRSYDLRAGLAGWTVRPELPSGAAPGATAHQSGAGLHLAAHAELELRRVLRGLAPESEVQLQIELRGSGPSLAARDLQLHVLGAAGEGPRALALDAGPDGALRGVLFATADAGGRVHVELLLANGTRALDLTALVLTLR